VVQGEPQPAGEAVDIEVADKPAVDTPVVDRPAAETRVAAAADRPVVGAAETRVAAAADKPAEDIEGIAGTADIAAAAAAGKVDKAAVNRASLPVGVVVDKRAAAALAVAARLRQRP
jgi:hypothetical protein